MSHPRHRTDRGRSVDIEGTIAEHEREAARRLAIAAQAAARGLSVQEYLFERACIRRARRIAAGIGLAYWPALRGSQIDPRAFAAAERVLERVHGHQWGDIDLTGARLYGGWDSAGVWGPSPRDVEQMWYAAGCRDSRKFRLQVEAAARLPRCDHGLPILRKGDSLPWARNYVRGWRWLRSACPCWRMASRKAIAVLGRLTPELRYVAIRRWLDQEDHCRLRIRDLDWERMRELQRRLQQAPPAARVYMRAALSSVSRAAQLLGQQHLLPPGRSVEEAIVIQLTPQYPHIPLEEARCIVLQEPSPDTENMSRRELHAWRLDGAPANVIEWLADHLRLPRHRSFAVVRWLQFCRDHGRWPALERERETAIEGRGMRRWSALGVLDEIQEEDIVSGQDGVEIVLMHVAARLGTAWLTRAMADHRPLAAAPAWRRHLNRYMRLLTTPAELAQEGTNLKHCVASYADAVKRGQSHIISISQHGRSTVELSPQLTLRQHRGSGNGDPPRRHDQLIRAWIARMQRNSR